MKIGQLRTTETIDKAMREIREWLTKINVEPMSLNTNWDARQNIALLKFSRKGKSYEFRSSKQNNCRLNMHAIARVMEYKVRAHLMGIEEFETAMSPYLQLEGYSTPTQEVKKGNDRFYAIIGISPLASNDELTSHYKKMAKSWHPDMAGSEEAKVVFEQKFSELNQAWSEIKKERGIA